MFKAQLLKRTPFIFSLFSTFCCVYSFFSMVLLYTYIILESLTIFLMLRQHVTLKSVVLSGCSSHVVYFVLKNISSSSFTLFLQNCHQLVCHKPPNTFFFLAICLINIQVHESLKQTTHNNKKHPNFNPECNKIGHQSVSSKAQARRSIYTII